MAKSAPSRSRTADNNTGLIPVLARTVREVESAAGRGPLKPVARIKFQVVALLMREERARAKTDPELSEADRAETLKRLDGIASILAKTTARDTSLISLLDPQTAPSAAAQRLRRELLASAGIEAPEVVEPVITSAPTMVMPELIERQVVPKSVKAKLRSNPFLEPDLDTKPLPVITHYLANWELLGPLFQSFERGAGGGSACMALPDAPRFDRISPPGHELMLHQSKFLQSVREGHRSYLLADEPGLGKTAQSLLAASIADAYPLLVVVPNVVKMNWARETEVWTPQRRAAVIHGDGADLDAFADVIIVNYEVLDRHLSWLTQLGFKGMVVDEAHFIKNRQSQRSKHVLALAESIRRRDSDALLLALTGTPLINEVDDFKAIWKYLGWIDDTKPLPELMARLEQTGLIPSDSGFFAEARQAVIDMGIVRRRKIDVAADLPAKRVVDLPVELDDELGRSIRAAEEKLTARLLERYKRLSSSKIGDKHGTEELIRMVALAELEESKGSSTGENVFSMVRRIGQAKSGLAADYTAQLARSVGKVVFFAKHIDVMDAAEAAFAAAGLRSISIRGDQTTLARQAAVDAFNNDDSVSVAVCSLTAAGVGLNLQAASNVVLAELSWTEAEQTQAIDRVHRIGQIEPVTAWRIVAAQTIDAKIAELIDSKGGLAARALDGERLDETEGTNVQLEALVHLLSKAVL